MKPMQVYLLMDLYCAEVRLPTLFIFKLKMNLSQKLVGNWYFFREFSTNNLAIFLNSIGIYKYILYCEIFVDTVIFHFSHADSILIPSTFNNAHIRPVEQHPITDLITILVPPDQYFLRAADVWNAPPVHFEIGANTTFKYIAELIYASDDASWLILRVEFTTECICGSIGTVCLSIFACYWFVRRCYKLIFS